MRPVKQFSVSKRHLDKVFNFAQSQSAINTATDVAWTEKEVIIDINVGDTQTQANFLAYCTVQKIKVLKVANANHLFTWYAGFRSAARTDLLAAPMKKLLATTFNGFHHEYVSAATIEEAKTILLDNFPDATDVQIVAKAEAQQLLAAECAA